MGAMLFPWAPQNPPPAVHRVKGIAAMGRSYVGNHPYPVGERQRLIGWPLLPWRV